MLVIKVGKYILNDFHFLILLIYYTVNLMIFGILAMMEYSHCSHMSSFC